MLQSLSNLTDSFWYICHCFTSLPLGPHCPNLAEHDRSCAFPRGRVLSVCLLLENATCGLRKSHVGVGAYQPNRAND